MNIQHICGTLNSRLRPLSFLVEVGTHSELPWMVVFTFDQNCSASSYYVYEWDMLTASVLKEEEATFVLSIGSINHHSVNMHKNPNSSSRGIRIPKWEFYWEEHKTNCWSRMQRVKIKVNLWRIDHPHEPRTDQILTSTLRYRSAFKQNISEAAHRLRRLIGNQYPLTAVKNEDPKHLWHTELQIMALVNSCRNCSHPGLPWMALLAFKQNCWESSCHVYDGLCLLLQFLKKKKQPLFFK